MKILIDNLLMQIFHIPNRTMCFSKNIFYQYFAGFFTQFWKASTLKTFHMSLHNSKNLKKL